ncbi:hypothetical protein V2G26_002319 [Clonostachys chloroleuca]
MESMIANSEAQLKAEDAMRLRLGDLEEDIDRNSSWVKRLGWVRHFGSHDLLSIYQAAEWIRAKAPIAGRAQQSFDREVDRCCWRLDSVPMEMLQWLGSITAANPSGVPFGRKGKEVSMSKYRSVGHRYLSFCWRAYRIGREEAYERWAVRFTDEQWSLLCDVVGELEGVAFSSSYDSGFCSGREREVDESDGDVGSDEDDDSGEREVDDEDVAALLYSALDRAVFLFISASVKVHVGGNVYINALLSFCAALGIRQRPLGYTEPHLYTGMLAAVLWWGRLFFLESIFENQPRDQDEVSIDAVLAFREQYTAWMCTGTHTVVSTIIGWMAYGKVHMGEQISIESFTRTLRDQITEAHKLLDGLFGGTWETVSRAVDINRIADSMVRLGAGQSFATDPRNRWLKAGPAKVMRLIETSIWDSARSRWKRQGVVKWLRRLRLLRETLMLLVHIWGGLPGRGPELTTMRHCDSWQLIRNVFVMDGQVMIVTDRDKMKAIRDNGRKVARRADRLRGSWNIVWDLQSTHGTRIARQHYAVYISFPGKLQPEMIAIFKEISKLWHQFLEGSSAEDKVSQVRKRKGRVPDKQNAVDGAALATRRKRTRTGKRAGRQSMEGQQSTENDIADGLQTLFGPDGAWRSDKQAESMRSIMLLKNGQAVISVLATGAGKSILFMLPAVMRDTGTSIVMVPFVALMDDLVMRARATGVDCIRYRALMHSGREGMLRAARLVVVSADVISSAEFSGYADGLLYAGLLQRIFIDECHTIIMDVGYRAKLGELRSLHRYRCPMVLLTAMLPVMLEDWFRSEMLVDSAVMVRDRAAKLNCRYKVEQVKPGRGAVEKRTAGVVEQLGGQLAGRQKGVVYCRSRGQCEAIAEEIGCSVHHSGMSEEDRREARTAWVEGRASRWIVAITGLGTGVDVEGIVAIVHAEQPYRLVDFVQQVGRGGRRAGEVVQSVIIHDGRPQRIDRHSSFVDRVNQAQMDGFVSTPGCRRAVIAAFMDGVTGERYRDIVGATLCDHCELSGRVLAGESGGEDNEGSSEGIDKGGTIWRAFGRREGIQIRILFRWLDEVADECPVCYIHRHHRGIATGEVSDEP